jgi:hypothetical protein
MDQYLSVFWGIPLDDLLRRLQSTSQGLNSEEAQQRLDNFGPNLLKPKKRADAPTLLWAQFKSPIILILLFAAGLSYFLREPTNAGIIIAIVLVSGLLGFWQEHGATNTMRKLIALVQVKTTVLRDQKWELLRTFTLLMLIFTSQFRVYIVRERKFFWSSRPGGELLISTTAAIIVFALLGVYGIIISPLTPFQVLFLIGFSALFTFAIDIPKHIAFQRFGL